MSAQLLPTTLYCDSGNAWEEDPCGLPPPNIDPKSALLSALSYPTSDDVPGGESLISICGLKGLASLGSRIDQVITSIQD
jgi:hypothetical protein